MHLILECSFLGVSTGDRLNVEFHEKHRFEMPSSVAVFLSEPGVRASLVQMCCPESVCHSI